MLPLYLMGMIYIVFVADLCGYFYTKREYLNMDKTVDSGDGHSSEVQRQNHIVVFIKMFEYRIL